MVIIIPKITGAQFFILDNPFFILVKAKKPLILAIENTSLLE